MKIQVTVLLLLAAGTVKACPQGNGGRNEELPTGTSFIARLDQDGDRKISQDEFDGPTVHFSHFDANGDGYINEDEAPTGPPSRLHGWNQGERDQTPPRGEHPQHGEEEQKQPAPRAEGGFISRFNQDADGQVSEDEFDGPAEHFEHFDRNTDGYISKDEAPKGPPPRKPKS